MKIILKEKITDDLNEEKFKEFLNLIGYKDNFTINFSKKDLIFDVQLSGKIDKNIKKILPFIIKGNCYGELINRKGVLFKCYIIGIDSIVLPRDFIKVEEMIKIREIIPHIGLKKGIEAYLKFRKSKETIYILINNLKEESFKSFSIYLFEYLIKNYEIKYFEIEKGKDFSYHIISFNKIDNFFPIESFAFFLESLAKKIFIEKKLQNEL